MPAGNVDAVVAGHICLDVIPEIGSEGGGLKDMLTPGSLVEVGPAVFSTGGAVANTGLALNRLGLRTRLMGLIGDDLFGRAILERLCCQDEELADWMIIAEGQSTSYTLVISAPGVDRVFLHSSGANNLYTAADISLEQAERARLFHFGYPPIMREIYMDGGRGLADLMERLRKRGVVTSLDMSQPDPDSEAGLVDWQAWLARVLPAVDLFAPSFEEILFMLDRPRFEQMLAAAGRKPLIQQADAALLRKLSAKLLEMGARVVALKVGDQGLYLRTTAQAEDLQNFGQGLGLDPTVASGREMLVPCFKTDVVGTTGAGDATVAGLLGGLLRGQSLQDAVTTAVGVGAFSTEATDAMSGVADWEVLQGRIAEGWERLPLQIQLPG